MRTDNIQTKEDFMAFVEELRNDLKANPSEWENSTLDDFLEALSRYTEDIDGYYQNMNININPEKASWRQFADIFMGARIYE